MRLVHHPEILERWPAPTAEAPWRVLVSGCMAGWACGVDETDYGMGRALADLLALPTFEAVPFCPEDVALGTPRTMPDIHGGDGFAVLDGTARVLDEHGTDLTKKMIAGAHAMLEKARDADVRFAILTDMSAACGTQVISDGCRFDEPRRYQRGFGVAAALLIGAGIPVVAQRDFKTLGRIRSRLDPGFVPDSESRDHHEHPWVVENLPASPDRPT
ncbi:MAG: 2-thiouracil desulfurase family protein [Planctomycetota bacterium]|jgi:uncharacterized protein YbbK (DUF523 family)